MERRKKRIELSIPAARVLWPINLDIISQTRDMFANKIMQKMLKKRKDK